MKIKRFLAAVLSAAVLCQTAPCFAETRELKVELSVVGDSLLITGDGCRSTFGTVSVRIENPDGSTCYLNQIEAADDGSFSLSVGMGADSSFGVYTVFVRDRGARTAATGSATYLGEQTKLDVVRAVNGAQSSDEMLSVLETWRDAMRLSSVSEDELSNAAIVLFEQKPQSGYTAFDEITAVILQGREALAALNASTASTFAAWISASGETISNQSEALATFGILKLSDKQAAAGEVLAYAPYLRISVFREKFAAVMEQYAARIPQKHLTLEAEVNLGVITVKGEGCVSQAGGVTFRAENPEGGLSNLNQITPKADGSFEYSFKPRDDERSGDYTLTVYGRGLTDSTKIVQYCLTTGSMKRIALELDAERSAEGIAAKLLQHDDEMRTGLFAAQLSNAAQVVSEQLTRGGAYSYEQYIEKLQYSVKMMEELNQADWLKLDGVISKYGTALLTGCLQTAKYNGLAEGVRNQLCSAMLEHKPFVKLAGNGSFRSVFDAVVGDYKAPSGDGGGSGGGGGGGGSFGGGSTSFPSGAAVTDSTSVPTSDGSGNSEPFSDLASVDWAETSILKLYKKGVISPSDDRRFRPLDNVTREEFIKLVVGAFGLIDLTAKSEFSDADRNEWYYPFISSAYERGIVLGYEDGTFGIGKEISRQEMAMMIYRAAVLCEFSLDTETESGFADESEISDYAKEAVSVMKASGVLSGDENGMFRPENFANRAEAAKVLAYILDKK